MRIFFAPQHAPPADRDAVHEAVPQDEKGRVRACRGHQIDPWTVDRGDGSVRAGDRGRCRHCGGHVRVGGRADGAEPEVGRDHAELVAEYLGSRR